MPSKFESLTELFRREISKPEEAIPLAEAALLIAQQEYPSLDRGTYLAQLEELGRQAKKRIRSEDPYRILETVSDLLFREMSFRGNAEEYYDPRNSFLNDVLDRRLGIPITLSLVYMEVARRVGIPLEGVGMPGHFLVKYRGASNELFIDPFHQGALLTAEECRQRWESVYEGSTEFRADFLASVSKRHILVRMLNNLQEIYSRMGKAERALPCVEWIVLADDSPRWLPQRGLLHAQMKNYGKAIADFQDYLARDPEAADAEEIRKHVEVLRHLRAMVN